MNCLWCDEELIIQITWDNIFQIKRSKLCERCASQLEQIKGENCVVCSKVNIDKICADCKNWQRLYDGEDPLIKNVSLFSYNLFMKEVVTRWKYQGDYILGEIFAENFYHGFKTNYSNLSKNLQIIPIPLSNERAFERAFNQSEVLASFLDRPMGNSLTRKHSEKQAKKTKIQRITAKNPFSLREPINKPVLLVDDIYTTGSTLRHAATLLKANGCPEVYAYTLIRG